MRRSTSQGRPSASGTPVDTVCLSVRHGRRPRPPRRPRARSALMRDVLTLILAGGKGTRLEPLTRDRAKPAVPFGGLYRIIDFTLSNCVNSGLRRVLVLT